MKKVILLKGLPASGKSTWARQQVDEGHGQVKRVNKDDLRMMLDNAVWGKASEVFVLEVRDKIVQAALEKGYSVIVDDTNFAPVHEVRMRQLAEMGGAEFEKKVFDVPIDECIRRDLKRPISVGEKVIRRMAREHLNTEMPVQQNPLNPKAIICDIDGTIAHMDGRQAYDWDKVHTDKVDQKIRKLLIFYHSHGYQIIFMSGRDGACRDITGEWLEKHLDPLYRQNPPILIMRAAGDNRKDSIVKEELFRQHVLGKYFVEIVIDDRDQVVEMWRRLGLKCLQVAYGDF